MFLHGYWRFILLIICLSQLFIWFSESQGNVKINKQQDFLDQKKKRTKFTSYFAICAIVKDEPDLREWVDYHYRMGCGRFYITDNGEKISAASQLQDYVTSKIVVINQTRAMAQQLPAYQRCLNRYRKLHQWMAFIDADEFIVTNRYCSIPGILRYYTDYGGIGVHRVLFGSSGHVTKPAGGVISNYQNCKATPHLKSIVNLDYAIRHVGNPHFFYFSQGKHAVTMDFERIDKPTNKLSPHLFEIMYINHYHLKSKQEFAINRRKGRADHLDYNVSEAFKDEKYFIRYDKLCKNNCTTLRIPATRVQSCSKLSLFTAATKNSSTFSFYMKSPSKVKPTNLASLSADQKVKILAEMIKKEKNITLTSKNLADLKEMIKQQLEKKRQSGKILKSNVNA